MPESTLPERTHRVNDSEVCHTAVPVNPGCGDTTTLGVPGDVDRAGQHKEDAIGSGRTTSSGQHDHRPVSATLTGGAGRSGTGGARPPAYGKGLYTVGREYWCVWVRLLFPWRARGEGLVNLGSVLRLVVDAAQAQQADAERPAPGGERGGDQQMRCLLEGVLSHAALRQCMCSKADTSRSVSRLKRRACRLTNPW